jgi:hypothetical protein
MLVVLVLLASTSSCGESDKDDDGGSGTSGASTGGNSNEPWTCEVDSFGDCMCAREPGGSVADCGGDLPCCASYTMPDFGPICGCRNLTEDGCLQFLGALPAERVSNCPPD